MNLIKGDMISKRAGLLMLQAVVDEFNTATATPLGLSVDYHQQCSITFQASLIFECLSGLVPLEAISGWLFCRVS